MPMAHALNSSRIRFRTPDAHRGIIELCIPTPVPTCSFLPPFSTGMRFESDRATVRSMLFASLTQFTQAGACARGLLREHIHEENLYEYADYSRFTFRVGWIPHNTKLFQSESRWPVERIQSSKARPVLVSDCVCTAHHSMGAICSRTKDLK